MAFESLNLNGRVAVVTGGSRGIGKAIVELLSESGAKVVVNYIKERVAAEAVVNSITQKGREAISVQADVRKVDDGAKVIHTAIAHYDRIDILVCNAGIWEGAPVEKISEDLWDRTMEINLKGTWTVCRAAIAEMKKQRSGKIVMLTSTAGQRGEANYSNYAASKGAQIAFTKSLAEEVGAWGINVNAVAPGWVDTDMTEDALGNAAQRAEISRTIPLGRIATPDEIAPPVVFLCSDWASHITGEILNVNGGSVLCG